MTKGGPDDVPTGMQCGIEYEGKRWLPLGIPKEGLEDVIHEIHSQKPTITTIILKS